MADVAYRGTSNGTSTTISAPAGIQNGDLMLVTIVGNPAPGVPTGWTQIGSTLGPSSGYYGVACWRIRQSGDTTYTSSNAAGWTLHAVYNTDSVSPIQDSNFAIYTANTNIPLPSLTANSVAGDGAVYSITGLGFYTYTVTTYSERQDVGTSQTSGDRLGLTSSQTTSGTVVSSGTDTSFVLHAIAKSSNTGVVGYSVPGYYM